MAKSSFPKLRLQLTAQIFSLVNLPHQLFSSKQQALAFIFEKMSAKYLSLNNYDLSVSYSFK